MSAPVVLVLRALGLGDFFTGLPALSLLRQARPHHRIVLAVPTALWPLARLAAQIDDVVQAHELDPISDPPRAADLAVDLHGNGPESLALLEATGPRHLVAFASPTGPQWRADEHEVSRWCRLVREGLGVDVPCPPVAGALPAPAVGASDGLTLVHCGAKSPARRWPAARFASVAAALRDDGHDVVVVGGPAERELAESIARSAGVPAATSLSLLELVATTARARMVVSGDTGIAHVATNYRTPSVVLFGPVSPAVWGPPPVARHQVLWHGDGTGDPHAETPDPALLQITVEEVLRAAQQALDASTAPPAPPATGTSQPPHRWSA